MSILRKITSLFGTNKRNGNLPQEDNPITSQAAEGKTEEVPNPFDDYFKSSFLHGEAEYQHQPRRMDRFSFGDKIRLGDVVDFIMNYDVSKSLIGLSICRTNQFGGIDETRFINNKDEICSYNILLSVSFFNDEGELYPLTGENVTLTLSREEGLPIVLFVRNMWTTPDMHYIRIYSMVSGSNANDDMHTSHSKNLAALSSTLLSYRASSKNLDDLMHLYHDTEDKAILCLKQGKPFENDLQEVVCEGMFGQRTSDSYVGYGNWLFGQSRYFDAQRQYGRALHALDKPSENINHGDIYGELNHKMAHCLMATHDMTRAFHFMDIAHYFKANIQDEYLLILAGLTDYRTKAYLEQLKGNLDEHKVETIKKTYQNWVSTLRKDLADDTTYLTLGFILQHILRVNSCNVISMCICSTNKDEYTYFVVTDKNRLWKYKLQDLLHDGNTIVLRYSRAHYQCGDTDDDKSKLCHDNSIIIQVNAIDGFDLFRIDIAIPAFIDDPDKTSPYYNNFSDYKSFVISSKPKEYDFSKPIEKIMEEACSFYNTERTQVVESMLGLFHVYLSLLIDFDKISDDNKFMCLDAAAKIGSCYMELDMPEVANYFLDVGYRSYSLNNMMEYINCLVNTKDVRAMSVVDNNLLLHLNADEQTKNYWHAFLKRRKAYVLIDWGQIAEAKDFLKTLLDDPLCKDYASRELNWLAQMEKGNNQ